MKVLTIKELKELPQKQLRDLRESILYKLNASDNELKYLSKIERVYFK